MNLFRKMKKQLNRANCNSHGFTLVELIVAFAILGTAFLGIGGFMVTGIRSYNGVNAETKVQNEAQSTRTKLQDLVIDASLGVSYNVVTDDGSAHGLDHFVKSDSDASITGTVCDKYFYVFNWDNARSSVVALIIHFDPEEQKLYYAEKNISGSSGDTTTIASAVNAQSITTWELMAEGVETFAIDMSGYENTGKITASIKMIRSGKSFSTSLVITLRNNVLINPENIGQVYDRADKVISSDITGIELTTSSNTIVKGGTLQLTTKVLGTGYPSQSIYQWKIEAVSNGVTVTKNNDGYLVASGDETGNVVLYDSLLETSQTNGYDASINATTKVLNLNNEYSGTYLKITATVYGGGKKDSDGNLIYYSASRYVAVKDIATFSITPTVEDIPQNSNLYIPNNTFATNSTADNLNNQTQFKVDAYPGNIIQMVATVDGDNLDTEDKSVTWKVFGTYKQNGEDTTLAFSIDDTGRISIGSNCLQGYAIIEAYPNLNPSMVRYYRINIGNKYGQTENVLEITGDDTVYRGATLQLGLTLNGSYSMAQSELSDFNWTISIDSVSSAKAPAGAVSISDSGLVTVAEDLPYDYEYKLLVTASMISNPEVSSTKIITVPRVSLHMNPNTYIGAQRGKTIPADKIKCVVIGVKDYTLKWTIASQTNPRYYNTSLVNGSSISAAGKDSCTITISGSEPSSLTYMRARAALDGHEATYAETYISLTNIDLAVTPTSVSLDRGESALLTATLKPADSAIPTSSITWKITGATVKNTGKSLSDDDLKYITLSSGTGSTTTVKVDSEFPLSSSEIDATVLCSLGGLEDTVTVKIPGNSNFGIQGGSTVNRGGSITLSVSSTYGKNVTWTVESNKDQSKLVTSYPSNGTITINVPADYDTANGQDYIYVSASLDGTTISANDHEVTVKQVTLDLNRKDDKSYVYTATPGNIDSNYTIAWGLTEDASTTPNELVSGTSTSKAVKGVTIKANGSQATVDISGKDDNLKKIEIYAAVQVDGTTLVYHTKTLELGNKLKSYNEVVNLPYDNWSHSYPECFTAYTSYDATGYYYGREYTYTSYYHYYCVSGYGYTDNESGITYLEVKSWVKREKNNSNSGYNYAGPGNNNTNKNYYYLAKIDNQYYYIDGSSSNHEWTEITAGTGNIFKLTAADPNHTDRTSIPSALTITQTLFNAFLNGPKAQYTY